MTGMVAGLTGGPLAAASLEFREPVEGKPWTPCAYGQGRARVGGDRTAHGLHGGKAGVPRVMDPSRTPSAVAATLEIIFRFLSIRKYECSNH